MPNSFVIGDVADNSTKLIDILCSMKRCKYSRLCGLEQSGSTSKLKPLTFVGTYNGSSLRISFSHAARIKVTVSFDKGSDLKHVKLMLSRNISVNSFLRVLDCTLQAMTINLPRCIEVKEYPQTLKEISEELKTFIETRVTKDSILSHVVGRHHRVSLSEDDTNLSPLYGVKYEGGYVILFTGDMYGEFGLLSDVKDARIKVRATLGEYNEVATVFLNGARQAINRLTEGSHD